VYRTLFEIGGFSLHTFGLLVGLGFIAGLWIANRCGHRDGIPAGAISDLVIPWILLGGMVGARIVYVVSYWDEQFAGHPLGEIFQVWKGGLVFYGGLAGAALTAIVYIVRKDLPLWRVADCLAPGIALGHVFGRLGCFMNGCCHGRPSDLPWAVRFPKGVLPFEHAVHPAQLYEAALNLALCAALVAFHARRRFDGAVFASYLIAYAFIRTITEWFRGDYAFISNPASGRFTPGQTTSALILVTGIALWFTLRSRPRSTSTPAPGPSTSGA